MIALFLAGAFMAGTLFGIVVCCMVAAAGEADRLAERSVIEPGPRTARR